jgi:hypothetical protein
LNPLIVSYDAKRDLWVVRDGKSLSVMSGGALMTQLDDYRNRALGHADRGSLFSRLRMAWDDLNRIERVYLSDSDGLVIVMNDGSRWGKHGMISKS